MLGIANPGLLPFQDVTGINSGGLHLGDGLQLWPAMVLIDVVLIAAIVRMIRRHWMHTPA